MLCGNANFTILERVKILFGARFFIMAIDGKVTRGCVSFRVPAWAGEIKRNYQVSE